MVDDTEVWLMCWLKTTDDTYSLLDLRNLANPSSSSDSPYGTHLNPFQDHRPREYSPKAHYRIVFKEKGITIDRLTQFHDVMDALADIVDALHLLQRLGWVRCDVSIGNILRCEGGAKLADLEYAKKVNSSITCHKIRGTMHFMAVEAAAQIYLFNPPSDFVDRRLRAKRPKTEKDTPIPWTHNRLHDLESLWWVAAWIVFNNGFGRPKDYLDNLEMTSEKTRLDLLHFHRQNSFTITFSGMVDHVPDPQNEIYYELDYLRELLLEHYRKVESKLPSSIDLDASDNSIYSHFKAAFVFLRQNGPNYSLVLISTLRAWKANPERNMEQKICEIALPREGS